MFIVVRPTTKNWSHCLVHAVICHANSPSFSSMVYVVSIPAWMWSVTWQCSSHVPEYSGRIVTVWNVPGNKSNTSARCVPLIWGKSRQSSHYCFGRFLHFLKMNGWMVYLIVKAMAVEVCSVYVHLISHSHQIPIHFISNLHVQAFKVAID